jgi:hypothetical protein
VSEASNPISGSELDFLAEAARRIEYVVFVLSKVDLLDDRGVERARENEETIYNSPRFTADRFAEPTFLRFSAKVGADSGLRPLRERLDHVAAHYRVYGQLNAMRAMQSVIAQASVELAQHRSTAENSAVTMQLDRITGQLTKPDSVDG